MTEGFFRFTASQSSSLDNYGTHPPSNHCLNEVLPITLLTPTGIAHLG